MKNPFDLEEQYQYFLELVKLDESKMTPIQKRETKQAFMAGCSQMILLFRREVNNMEQDDAIAGINSILKQLALFWISKI